MVVVGKEGENMDWKARRKELGLTQTQAAKKCGVSLNTYRLWEEFVTTPRKENQERLEEVLGDDTNRERACV